MTDLLGNEKTLEELEAEAPEFAAVLDALDKLWLKLESDNPETAAERFIQGGYSAVNSVMLVSHCIPGRQVVLARLMAEIYMRTLELNTKQSIQLMQKAEGVPLYGPDGNPIQKQ